MSESGFRKIRMLAILLLELFVLISCFAGTANALELRSKAFGKMFRFRRGKANGASASAPELPSLNAVLSSSSQAVDPSVPSAAGGEAQSSGAEQRGMEADRSIQGSSGRTTREKLRYFFSRHNPYIPFTIKWVLVFGVFGFFTTVFWLFYTGQMTGVEQGETEVLIRADEVEYDQPGRDVNYTIKSVDVQDLNTREIETVTVEDFASRGWLEKENMNMLDHDFYVINQDLNGDGVNDIKVLGARFGDTDGHYDDKVWTPEVSDRLRTEGLGDWQEDKFVRW